jgi:hypothetical protein
MVDNRLVQFSMRVLRDARVILGEGPATHSALGATRSTLREIRWQIHR